MMKKYIVSVKYVFTGHFIVHAEGKIDAKRTVLEECGMSSSLGVHCINEDSIETWEFPSHPEEKIISVRKKK